MVKAKWDCLWGPHAFSFCVRQDYEELEKQLKEVFKERSSILRQLTKTSRELDGIKVNLQVRQQLIFSTAKEEQSPDLPH
jgi:septal ring factor EnvC (AmiA/AmiB activator)